MVSTSSGTFVYGRFLESGRAAARPPSMHPEIAIEILREFSSSEFIGKIYLLGPDGSWRQLSEGGAQNYRWYEGAVDEGKCFDWEMRGGDRWKVLHFKTENDESGPYVAVALKHVPREAGIDPK